MTIQLLPINRNRLADQALIRHGRCVADRLIGRVP